jgi:hypothetical protein
MSQLSTGLVSSASGVGAGLASGAGTMLRLPADYAVARTGGSLTGYEPGDNWPDEDEQDEADQPLQHATQPPLGIRLPLTMGTRITPG